MLEQVQSRVSYLSPCAAAVNYTVYADRREDGFPPRVVFKDGGSTATGRLMLTVGGGLRCVNHTATLQVPGQGLGRWISSIPSQLSSWWCCFSLPRMRMWTSRLKQSLLQLMLTLNRGIYQQRTMERMCGLTSWITGSTHASLETPLHQ